MLHLAFRYTVTGVCAALLPLLADPWGPLRGPAAYHVAPWGDDAGPGTATRPWATFTRAVAGLGPGDTLWVRGGTYAERGIHITATGTRGAPVSIRAFPREQPVIDGALTEFGVVPNAEWEVVDAAKEIYRSVKSYPGLERVYGRLDPAEGGFRLVPYDDFGPFSTDQQAYDDTWPYYYIGPGVLWDENDGRIYVRLKHSIYQQRMGVQVPAVTDPRNTPLVLFGDPRILEFEPTAAHIEVSGIDFRNGANAVDFDDGAHDITLRGCDLFGGRYHVRVRTGARRITLDRVTIADSVPPWIAWTDVKRPNVGRPGRYLQGAGVLLDGSPDAFTLRRSRFSGSFDGIAGTAAPTNLRVLGNRFDGIRDDVIQLGTAAYNVEIAHNVATRVHAGFSRDGPSPAPAQYVGSKFVHHNVIDTSTPHLLSRDDPKGLLPSKYRGPSGNGMGVGTAFGVHNIASGIDDPWHIYHNTVVCLDDVNNRGVGHTYPASFGPVSGGHVHECYNNIFVQLSDRHIARRAEVLPHQVYDGNLYWRPSSSWSTPLLRQFAAGSVSYDFDSLLEFRTSALFSLTQAWYAPGWEANGVEGDPGLNGGYLPSANGPAASGAVDLSATGWPGVVGETFRGARPPDAMADR